MYSKVSEKLVKPENKNNSEYMSKHTLRIELDNCDSIYFESNRDESELKALGKKIEELIGADFIDLFDDSNYIDDEEIRTAVTDLLKYGYDDMGNEVRLDTENPVIPPGGLGWFYTEQEVLEAWFDLLRIVDPEIDIHEVPNPVPEVYSYALGGIVGGYDDEY